MTIWYQWLPVIFRLVFLSAMGFSNGWFVALTSYGNSEIKSSKSFECTPDEADEKHHRKWYERKFQSGKNLSRRYSENLAWNFKDRLKVMREKGQLLSTRAGKNATLSRSTIFLPPRISYNTNRRNLPQFSRLFQDISAKPNHWTL